MKGRFQHDWLWKKSPVIQSYSAIRERDIWGSNDPEQCELAS
jgi:hypothetical protein